MGETMSGKRGRRPSPPGISASGDVESMIRDLVDIAIDMVREEKLDEIGDRRAGVLGHGVN